MDNVILPPPFPETPKRKMTYGKKCVLLGLQCLVLMLGALTLYGLVYSRERANRQVAREITRDWGGTIYFDGVLGVPCTVSTDYVTPDEFNCNVTIDAQTLHRGVYEAQVYNADVRVSGRFDKVKLQKALGSRFALYLDIPEHLVDKLGPVRVCGKAYTWQLIRDSLMVELDLVSLPRQIDFETSFESRGSGGFYVARIGENNNIQINGKAGNPSFQGESLPVARSVSHDRFEASWEGRGRSQTHKKVISGYFDEDDGYISYNDDYAVVEVVEQDYGNDDADYVGANFLIGVDRYQKVARSLKYSFIIILLTYIAVLAVEMIRKKRIPLLNYFLIGVALVIFYSLLLSFAELVAFWVAYLIAAAMTVGLISSYMGMSLNSRKIGVIIAIILTLYYGACYAMLSSTYALLLGSLLLFAAIALLMFATVRLRQ